MGDDRVILPFLEWTATGLSILGLYLMAKKKWQAYIPWIISAPMWVALGIMTQAYGTAVTFTVYQGMNFYGLYEWKFKKVEK
jgi:nicotinamide riboside transporter PnuC